MTARDIAKAKLVAEERWCEEEAAYWLGDAGHRGTLLHVYRTRRASALMQSGLAETERSERAGGMVRALLAVAGADQRGQGMP